MGAAAPAQAAQPVIADGSFNPLVGQAAVNASAAPVTGGAMRRSGRPSKQAPAPEMLRPAVPAEAPGAIHHPKPRSSCMQTVEGVIHCHHLKVVIVAPVTCSCKHLRTRHPPMVFVNARSGQSLQHSHSGWMHACGLSETAAIICGA